MLPLLTHLALAAEPDPIAAALDLQPVEHTLHNGLHLVVLEDHTAPVVAISLRVDSGAAEDGEGHTGAAHLFARCEVGDVVEITY